MTNDIDENEARYLKEIAEDRSEQRIDLDEVKTDEDKLRHIIECADRTTKCLDRMINNPGILTVSKKTLQQLKKHHPQKRLWDHTIEIGHCMRHIRIRAETLLQKYEQNE